MISVIIVSIIAILTGLAYVLFPRQLVRLSQWANRIIFRDEFFIRKNRITGIGLILVGVWLFWIYYRQRPF